MYRNILFLFLLYFLTILQIRYRGNKFDNYNVYQYSASDAIENNWNQGINRWTLIKEMKIKIL